MGHNEAHKLSAYKHCEVYTCNSKEECDDKLFGICKDLALSLKFPILVLSGRHSVWGMARFILNKCTETDVSDEIFDKGPLYFSNAFKSQPDSETIERIISEIHTHNVQFVLLDNCITDPAEYSPIAYIYDIPMLALNIKEQTKE